jgi:hypothetical protein
MIKWFNMINMIKMIKMINMIKTTQDNPAVEHACLFRWSESNT